jgi:hypothetical protein
MFDDIQNRIGRLSRKTSFLLKMPCPHLHALPPPIFVFESPQQQNAANAVYIQKKAFDAARAARGSKAVYTFKSDRERMQWLMGLYGQTSQGLA